MPSFYRFINWNKISLAIAYSLCYSTIKDRQAYYNNWNNSNELLSNYYADCSTDSECEQLESELKFDFKKGVNWDETVKK